jgi:hypothetical protein
MRETRLEPATAEKITIWIGACPAYHEGPEFSESVTLFCRPLRNHSATWPHEAGSIYSIKHLGNRPRLLRLLILKWKTAFILK